MNDLASDVRFGWRRLRATPAFMVFSVVTLALGIGVTSASYSVIRAVLAPPAGLRRL
jgi:putative ABC transport system permease protein